MVVERSEELLVHGLGLVKHFLEETSKADFLKAISVLLATLAEDAEEFLEALNIIIEGIAGDLDQLRQVLVGDIVDEDLTPFYKSLDDGFCEAERRGR